jgi:ABC-type multidrug transport system fused ATPase/permease subunit
VVGENGSGKSTIGKLIARLYDPDTGVIRVDDVDLRHFKTQILRELVCYLPQDAVLFTGSLRDNLLLGNPSASERELTWALEIAGLESVVSRLTGGLYGSLGPRALQISSGERQRIALARGILRRPGVLILDEATSFIDGASEYHILSTLAETLRTTTLIVISHHPSALYWADEILVLDNGRIAERGKHSDLCRNNHLYAQLFNRRLESGRSSPFKEGYSDLPLPRPRSSITNEN